jgi:tellurite methyltransferase
VAVARLAAEAAACGLPVRAAQADLREGAAFPRPPYDVVVCTFFLERALLGPMAAALAPGGLLVMETFTRAQAGRGRGPSAPSMLLEAGELAGAFSGLEVLHLRERDDGAMAVAGIVARRPA